MPGRARTAKNALLKLAADLLGVSFDDLKQREQERRVRRLMAAGAVTPQPLAVSMELPPPMPIRQSKHSLAYKAKASPTLSSVGLGTVPS